MSQTTQTCHHFSCGNSSAERFLKFTNSDLKITACDILGNPSTLMLHKQDILNNMQWIMANNNDFYMPDHSILFARKNTASKPVILIDDLKADNTAYVKTLHIRGKAESHTPITSLTVNQCSIPFSSGNMIVFDYPIMLSNGSNTICIKAQDQAGNTREKTILINKQIPAHLQLQERYRIFVHAFSSMYLFESPNMLKAMFSSIFPSNKVTGIQFILVTLK
ncbi:MAG: hypothetical protein OMM_04877 [Candidatus Magnetoglobus multicellularis str. Araruama]|uniref:Bacterial Ig-like domain-containing protein n=1 Tax=Candidatus Magnetoglobus multicellularis str. Araruama TaxID=890399 RepID=A0A1V1NZC4_9BACT|nr:MAG: hypothetical protein OMM_04877 [Candidatus Magnetoglobus multicellularis str. Araruama]